MTPGEIRRPGGEPLQAGLYLFGIVEDGDQGVLVIEQVHELRPGREHLCVYRNRIAAEFQHPLQGIQMIVRKKIVERPRRLLKAPGVGIGDVSEVPRFDIIELFRIYIVELRKIARAVRLIIMGIVVIGHHGVVAVAPAHAGFARMLFHRQQMPLPLRITARQIYQYPVEAVALLQGAQRGGESLGGKPDLQRIDPGLQEIMPDGKLAHHRHPVRDTQAHGGIKARF